MNKTVSFKVNNKEYIAVFRKNLSQDIERTFYTCMLMAMPSRIVSSGATIVHPNDIDNEEIGERIAFRRAVLSYILLVDKVHFTNRSREEIKAVIKMFQKAMGAEKFKYYGKEL